MAFQKKRINWKQLRPNSLKEALRLCKDYAKDKHNLSVAGIADKFCEYGHEEVNEDLLYKWLSTTRMPLTLVKVYERICGINYVSEYLASTSNRLVIEIPTGKKATQREINELQANLVSVVGQLLRFYEGGAEIKEVQDNIMSGIKGLAFHHENVEKANQPELELDQ